MELGFTKKAPALLIAHITTDPATAAAAVQTGEIDWVEQPLSDLLPVLRRARGVVIEPKEIFGNIGIVRFNHLHPPFNNQKLRQALLAVTDQKDYLAAIMGPDSPLTQAGVGVFTPGTPLASDEAMEKINGPRDFDAAKKLVAESGYKGERAVVMAPTDFAVATSIVELSMTSLVRGEMLARIPPWPVQTSATCLPVGSMVTTASTSATACAMVVAVSPPLARWAARAVGLRSKPMTWWPALSRFAAMGRPMLPRPIRATFMLPPGACAR
jgi:hypothetical protein